MEKKTITINLSILKPIFLAILLAIITVFIVEHFGQFSYSFTQKGSSAETTELSPGISSVQYYYDLNDPIDFALFKSPFGNEIKIDRGDWTIIDVKYSNGNFYDYSNIVKYYLKSTYTNFKYIIGLSALYLLLYFFAKRFKIKIKKNE